MLQLFDIHSLVWVWLLGTIVGSVLVSKVLSTVLVSLFKRYALPLLFKNLPIQADIKRLNTPLSVMLVGWFVSLVLFVLGFHGWIGVAILWAKCLTYAGFVWMLWRVAHGLQRLIETYVGQNSDRFGLLIAPFVGRFIKVIAVLFGFLSLAELLHFPITSLLTGLGIGGVAVAMAAKETIGNVFGSATVLIDRPFTQGDGVKIGDIEGTIEQLGFRSTRIRTFNDSLVIVPNANLLTATVENMTLRRFKRFKFQWTVDVTCKAEVLDLWVNKSIESLKNYLGNESKTVLGGVTDINSSGFTVVFQGLYKNGDMQSEFQTKQTLLLCILTLAQQNQIPLISSSSTIQKNG